MVEIDAFWASMYLCAASETSIHIIVETAVDLFFSCTGATLETDGLGRGCVGGDGLGVGLFFLSAVLSFGSWSSCFAMLLVVTMVVVGDC
jgi:hypothetical protein